MAMAFTIWNTFENSQSHARQCGDMFKSYLEREISENWGAQRGERSRILENLLELRAKREAFMRLIS